MVGNTGIVVEMLEEIKTRFPLGGALNVVRCCNCASEYLVGTYMYIYKSWLEWLHVFRPLPEQVHVIRQESISLVPTCILPIATCTVDRIFQH